MKKTIGGCLVAFFALAACSEAESAATAETVADAEQEVAGEPAYEQSGDTPAASAEPVVDEAALEEDAEKDFQARNPVMRPVFYGKDGPDLDACGGVGKVSGLKSGGDNFLSVRALPSIKGDEMDQIKNDQQVFFCEEDGPWIGIVYDKTGSKDCGTGSPIPEATTYIGPCDSGWVDGRYVPLIAG